MEGLDDRQTDLLAARYAGRGPARLGPYERGWQCLGAAAAV